MGPTKAREPCRAPCRARFQGRQRRKKAQGEEGPIARLYSGGWGGRLSCNPRWQVDYMARGRTHWPRSSVAASLRCTDSSSYWYCTSYVGNFHIHSDVRDFRACMM